MIILANLHDGVGCSYHRIEVPARMMRGIYEGISVGTTFAYDITTINWEAIDAIWFNRVPTFPPDALREVIKKHNIKLVVDIDDHWILYSHHEMAAEWKQSGAHEHIQQWLIEADMVFVTNSNLAAAATVLNKNVHIVPNALPFGTMQFTSTRQDTPLTNFMYAAGSSHSHDLELLRPVMKRLGKDARFRAIGQIILAGYDYSYGTGRVKSPWLRMLSVIKPAVSYAVLPLRHVNEYMKSYEFASVSLAPLEKSPFNACKSNLKILEAGCKCIPIICSNVEPYIHDAECPGVILCNTPQEWFDAIKKLLSNEELRRELGGILGEYVRKKYNMKEVSNRRIELFNSLLTGTNGISEENKQHS